VAIGNRLSPVLARSSRMSLVHAVPRLLGTEVSRKQPLSSYLRPLRVPPSHLANDRDEDRRPGSSTAGGAARASCIGRTGELRRPAPASAGVRGRQRCTPGSPNRLIGASVRRRSVATRCPRSTARSVRRWLSGRFCALRTADGVPISPTCPGSSRSAPLATRSHCASGKRSTRTCTSWRPSEIAARSDRDERDDSGRLTAEVTLPLRTEAVG
jgi:hypothetical protein